VHQGGHSHYLSAIEGRNALNAASPAGARPEGLG
jgi:hypothetical protein